MKSTASRLLPKGTERTLAHMDIQHPNFPTSLYLTREVLMNDVRHKATEVNFTYKEQPSGDFLVTIRDNGDGNADYQRLISPAEESGLGTARYGAGLCMYRVKNSGEYAPFSFSWKKPGDTFYHVLEQNSSIPKTMNAVAGSEWQTVESHGFRMTHILLRKALNEVKPSQIAHKFREIMCLSMTPETLSSIRIHIEVLDKTGALYTEPVMTKAGKEPKKQKKPVVTGIADSVDEKWKTLLEILQDNHVGDFPSAHHTLSKKAVANAKYFRLAPPPPKMKCLSPNMPSYTNKNAQHALFVQEGFVTDAELKTALKRSAHAASMNGRFVVLHVDRPLETIEVPNESELSEDEVFAQKERIRQDSILEPTSSKVTFEGETYIEALEFIRKQKPSGWIQFEKKAKTNSTTETDTDATRSDVEQEHIVEVPVITPNPHSENLKLMHELITQMTALASRLPIEVFNVPLEALEDWHANGGNVADDDI
jgi:hypothetical protein